MLRMGSQDILKEPQPKRRKIQLACNKCRNRKTRCDGHRPACIACLERGLAADCTYEPNVSTSQRSITRVDGHAQQLERRAFGAAPESTDNPDRNSYPGPDENSDITGRGTVFPSHSGTSNTAELLSSPTQTMHNTNDFDRVDGLATVAFPREDENLYGESSTITFVRHVMHEQLPSEHQQYKSPAPEPIRDRDESLAVYPRRQTADDYVSSFWEFVHPVFPILHKASFMSRYKEVWSSEPYKGPHNTDQADEVAFSATLNLTFALGCQFSSLVAANKRVVVADEFHQRSRRIFIYDILDTSSMPVLQMLLLTGVYLQSTKYAERCWNTVGLAIRAAQTLGLHSESPTRRPERQLTREIRRRVWHVCVTLDRLLAMTFGQCDK
ncbi:fungal-specific transcription factor domain-containing protein [Leptodontidium sp. MPI-SDFR-AT-0119]|nr:fungal-specific transcription factor domain-containing protein [Leptodontidium sp. MPI-SDFR-AT-0119]